MKYIESNVVLDSGEFTKLTTIHNTAPGSIGLRYLELPL